MYGYNPNYFSKNLFNSMRDATQKVIMNEEERKRKYLGSRTYYMDDIDKLSPEQQANLRQTQAAGEKAERDPSTGNLKVSGMIAGVPRTGRGGDLYGVDTTGRALVTVSQWGDFEDEEKPKATVPQETPPKFTGEPVGVKNIDISGTKDPHTVPFGIEEPERLRRLRNAENQAIDTAMKHGRWSQFDIPLELSTADIRKPEVGAFAPPAAASGVIQSVKPEAGSPLQSQIDRLEAIKQRNIERRRKESKRTPSVVGRFYGSPI